MVTGGSAANTVPADAQVSVDVRAATIEEQCRVDELLRGLAPALPRAVLSIERGAQHPPLPRSASAGLFIDAQRAAVQLGMPALRGVAVGGASDDNLTAGVGTPTLDGPGAVGGGAHADDEHVRVDAMPERAALFALVIAHRQRADHTAQQN
jgi:glutamate carboxypeptidase